MGKKYYTMKARKTNMTAHCDNFKCFTSDIERYIRDSARRNFVFSDIREITKDEYSKIKSEWVWGE